MPINVITSGILTTIQDLGRPGYYHLGIPVGGAMDRMALRTANLLVGNPEDAAGLEVVFMGPELEFTEDATIAVCGADLPPRVNGVEKPGWTAINVRNGDVLSFDFLRAGGPCLYRNLWRHCHPSRFGQQIYLCDRRFGRL